MLKAVLAMAAIVAALIFGLTYADAATQPADAPPGLMGDRTSVPTAACLEPLAHSSTHKP